MPALRRALNGQGKATQRFRFCMFQASTGCLGPVFRAKKCILRCFIHYNSVRANTVRVFSCLKGRCGREPPSQPSYQFNNQGLECLKLRKPQNLEAGLAGLKAGLEWPRQGHPKIPFLHVSGVHWLPRSCFLSQKVYFYAVLFIIIACAQTRCGCFHV